MKTLFLILAFALQATASPLAWAQPRPNEQTQVAFVKFESAELEAEGRPKLELFTYLATDAESIEAAVQKFLEAPAAARQVYLSSEEGPQNEADRAALREISQQVLQKASEVSPRETQINITSLEVPSEVVAQSSSFRERFAETYQRHERVALSVMRGTLNGAIAGSALILSAGLPVTSALPIALFIGSTSAGFQYFNASFQKFLNGDPQTKARLISEGRMGKVKFQFRQLSKIFVTNTGMFMLTNSVSALAGVPTGSLLTEAVETLRSSMISTFSSGLWSTTMASRTRDRLAAADGDQARQAQIQSRANKISFAVSMVGAFGSILTLTGTSLGYWTMGAIGISGLIFTIRTWSQMDRAQQTRPLRFNSAAPCRQVFAL